LHQIEINLISYAQLFANFNGAKIFTTTFHSLGLNEPLVKSQLRELVEGSSSTFVPQFVSCVLLCVDEIIVAITLNKACSEVNLVHTTRDSKVWEQ
jgi:hypothetical protein